MSKKFVSLTTLYSHIRSNHRLVTAKAFKILQVAATKESQSEFYENTAQTTEELKLTKMVQAFENLQNRKALQLVAFSNLQQKLQPQIEEIKESPYANCANLSFLVTRLNTANPLPAAFLHIKDYGAERHIQLEKAALYKEF